MKIIFSFSLVLATLLIACNEPVAQEDHSQHSSTLKEEVMSVTEQNKTIVRRIYDECLNKRNFDLAYELIAPGYAGPRGAKGPEGFVATVQPVINAFPDIQWTIDDLFAENDKVVVRWHWNGTHKEVFNTIPASQKEVVNNAIVIYQLKNNKVAAAWIQSDQLGFLQQVGVIDPNIVPAPPVKNN